ncbi:MAG: beta-ketoacyl-[acyl-carrier-protein] synthase family protein [Deltaproteobacteria bacterium]|nr:beta-ketoacyl-[acyl-carrier-protein] synthase family protein [Deltaproteobacteria bacterium]
MGRDRSAGDIVIVGYDMVTPLGVELKAQWEAFAAGRSGVGWVTRFEHGDGFPVRVAGQVPKVDFSKRSFWNERDAANWFSPVIFHSMLVAERALEHARFAVDGSNADRVAVTFSSAIGGLDAMIEAESKVNAGLTPHPFTNPNGCLNMVAGKVSILTGARGPIFCPVAACATGSASVASAAMLLASGRADVVIAGACDFPVVRSLMASFASMNGAFQSRKPDDRAFDDPTKVSRPFSRDRKGFVVSEGAAALVVTTRGHADRLGLEVRAVIEGIGMTSDASHYVAPNLPTIAACIRAALADARLSPDDIDAVNAHAASTSVGDATEVKALDEVFGARRIPVSANKSQIGHSMGASSAVELILAIEGLRRGVLLPTINYDPDPKVPVDAVPEGARPMEQRRVLSNSFGFGGCNVCLVVGRE